MNQDKKKVVIQKVLVSARGTKLLAGEDADRTNYRTQWSASKLLLHSFISTPPSPPPMSAFRDLLVSFIFPKDRLKCLWRGWERGGCWRKQGEVRVWAELAWYCNESPGIQFTTNSPSAVKSISCIHRILHRNQRFVINLNPTTKIKTKQTN